MKLGKRRRGDDKRLHGRDTPTRTEPSGGDAGEIEANEEIEENGRATLALEPDAAAALVAASAADEGQAPDATVALEPEAAAVLVAASAVDDASGTVAAEPGDAEALGTVIAEDPEALGTVIAEAPDDLESLGTVIADDPDELAALQLEEASGLVSAQYLAEPSGPHEPFHASPLEGTRSRGDREGSQVAVGAVMGSYRVRALLGQGAVGRVYQAEHVLLGKTVALKVLRGELCDTPGVVSRFFAEARALAQVAHENIVKITDLVSATDGPSYFVMELLEGETLADRLHREGRLSVEAIISIARQIARALAAAHEVGIVHRDLKPENVFLVANSGGGEVVKLLDFGVAKLTRVAKLPSGRSTLPGALIGTPQYMSPEQACAQGAVDHRVDVYALGVVIYELLTGTNPFTGEDLVSTLMRQVSFEAPLPSSLGIPTPPALERLVVQLLAKSPDHRPQSAALVEATLAELEAELASGAPAEAPAPAPAPLPSLSMELAMEDEAWPWPRRGDEAADDDGEDPPFQPLAVRVLRKPGTRRAARWALALAAGLAGAWLMGRGDAATDPDLLAARPPAAATEEADELEAPRPHRSEGPAPVRVIVRRVNEAEAPEPRDEAEAPPKPAMPKSPRGAVSAPGVEPGGPKLDLPAHPASSPAALRERSRPRRTLGRDDVIDPFTSARGRRD